MERVCDVLTRALSGEGGGVVVVDGATGMGKSRLVHEALEAAPEATRSVLRGEPYGLSSTYRALRDPMRSLLGIERDTHERMGQVLLERLRERVPDLLPFAPLLADVAQVSVPSTTEVDRIDPEFRADRVADAVIDLVERLVPGRSRWSSRRRTGSTVRRPISSIGWRPPSSIAPGRWCASVGTPGPGSTPMAAPASPSTRSPRRSSSTWSTPRPRRRRCFRTRSPRSWRAPTATPSTSKRSPG